MGHKRANKIGDSFPMIIILSLWLHFTLPSEARSFPATASRSFRFPSTQEEELWNSIKSLNIVNDKSAHLNRNNIPSSSDPRSSHALLEGRQDSGEFSKSLSSSDSEESSSSEVVVIDLKIKADQGELKETNLPKEDEELRQALCPHLSTTKEEESKQILSSSKDEDFPELRYDLQAGKCAIVGRKEHCGGNMIFVADLDSSAYGFCECDFENKLRRKASNSQVSERPFPLVYHQSSNSCHRLYEQAFCKDGEWLILTKEKKGPTCESRKCPVTVSLKESVPGNGPQSGSGRRRQSKLLTPSLWTSDNDNSRNTKVSQQQPQGRSPIALSNDKQIEWVPLNGTGPCVQLNRENLEFCEAGEKVIFRKGSIIPKCGFPGREAEARAVILNACPPGSFYSIIGRCQADWDF